MAGKGKANWSAGIKKMNEGIYRRSGEAGTLREPTEIDTEQKWEDAGGREQWQWNTSHHTATG